MLQRRDFRTPRTTSSRQRLATALTEVAEALADLIEQSADRHPASASVGELLTTKEAAARLRVSVRTIERLIEAGDIVPVHLRRSVRINPDELVQLKT